MEIIVPMDVPKKIRSKYIENYLKITKNTGKLMLFAGDQKIEHMNDDFFGEGIDSSDNNPSHMFNIASESRIGVFATQLGLISRYGSNYPEIPYLVKLNSKTNLLKNNVDDPYSSQINTVEQVIEFSEDNKLNILGIGYSIYLGSKYESKMMQEASKAIYEAHKNGLISVLWVYPRGISIDKSMERDPHILAGSTGVATCLGSDFVKINTPIKSLDGLKEAVISAGNTKVICAGGKSLDPLNYLQIVYDMIHNYGVSGTGTGRNIHQKKISEAIGMCNAISSIILDNYSVEDAFELYRSYIK